MVMIFPPLILYSSEFLTSLFDYKILLVGSVSLSWEITSIPILGAATLDEIVNKTRPG